MTDAQPRLLIRNDTLIDGSGCDPVRNTLVVVQENRITHVGPADSSIRPESPDDTVFDATGKFNLPGLIDAHCHISLHQGALPGVKYTSSRSLRVTDGPAPNGLRVNDISDAAVALAWTPVAGAVTHTAYRAERGRSEL